MAVDGTWTISIQTPMGARDATVELKTAGGVTGTFGNQRGSGPIYDASVNGDAVAFCADFESAMGKMKLEFTGTVSGDAMTGTVVFGALGNGAFTGSRA